MKKQRIKRIFSLVLTVIMTLSFSLENFGVAKAEISNPNVNYVGNNAYASVHDPSILKVGDTYYMYSTGIIGDGVELRTSTDLVSWTYVSSFEEQHDNELKVSAVMTATGNAMSNIWAPDVVQVGDEYWMFYSCSGVGSRNSCIALAKATSPTGPFTYQGIVIQTSNSTVSNMNAIDACIEYDQAGNMWMAYGSFFGGIRVVQLDKTTGFVKSNGDEGTLIASRPSSIDNGAVEGPIIRYHDGYYYLFVAYDSLLGPERNGGGSYHIRVGRSTTINGEYVDQDGVSMKQAGETTGYKLTANYKFDNATGWWAVGHCDIYEDTNGKWIYASHARINGNENAPYSFIHQLTWNEEGWPLISPEPYVGETIGRMNVSDAAGLYERIAFHDNKETLSNTLTSVDMNLNSDYSATIEGIGGTGTWSFSGDNTVTVSIGNVTEVYTLMEGWDAENNVATVVLTGNDMSSGSTGLQRWGKRIVHYEAPGYTINVATNNESYGTVSGGGTVESGDSVTVTASEKTGYSFIHWVDASGDVVSANKSYTFTPSNNATLTAMFSNETNPTITAATNNGSYGTVSGSGTVVVGNVITLTATPIGGNRFVAWKDSQDNVLSTNAVFSMRAYETETITAYFESLSEYYVADYLSDGSKFYDTLDNTGNTFATLSGTTSVDADGIIVNQGVADTQQTNYAQMANPFKNSTADAVTLIAYMAINETEEYDYRTLYTFYTDVGFLTITANGGIHLNDWTGNYFDNADGVWTPDSEEHLYSLVVTNSAIKVYEDGTLINEYACGSNILTFIKSCEYVSLGTGNDTYSDEYGGWAWASASTKTSELVFLEAELTATDFESMMAGGEPCTITVSTAGNGTVSGPNTEINAGKTATVTANANPGYRFAYWKDASDNIVSTSATYTFKVKEDTTLTAHFLSESSFVDITVNSEDLAKGNVTGSKTDVIIGTPVTITATPTKYYKFKGWQLNSAIVSTNATYTFSASADATYTALFEIDTDKIATSTFLPQSDDRLWAYYNFNNNYENQVNGHMPTTVAAGGNYIAYSPQYVGGTSIQIGPYGLKLPNDVEVGSTQVTVSFWINTYNYNTVNSPMFYLYNSSTGDWTSILMNTSAYSNNCIQTWSEVDGAQTNNTTSIQANTGTWINVILTIDGNNGDLYINGTKQIDNLAVGDIFSTNDYAMYVGANPWSADQLFYSSYEEMYIYDGVLTDSEIGILSNGGTYNGGEFNTATITINKSDANAGTVYGAGDVIVGNETTVIARPNDGYEFVGWKDAGENTVSTDQVYTFTPSGDTTLTAEFRETQGGGNQQSCTVTVENQEGGTVEGAGSYTEGDNVTLTAVPDVGYTFIKWQIDGVDAGTDTTLTIPSISGDKNIKAVFEKKTYTVTVTEPEGGTVQGAGSYKYGDNVTLTAEPNDGYEFVKWQINGVDAGTNTTLNINSINGNKTITAIFNEVVTPPSPPVEPAKKVRLTVAGPNLYVNGERQQNAGYTELFEVGTEITLLCDNDGFVRWYNYDQITMCDTKTYTFTIVTDTNLTAVTVNDMDNDPGVYSAYVEFVSFYGQVMQATTWYTTSTNKTIPDAPARYGYAFTGWSADGINALDTVDDVKALIDGTTNHLVLSPMYVPEGSTYTITVYHDDELTPVTYDRVNGANLTIPSKSIAGKRFSHWSNERNGATKISTNENLFMKVAKDKVIYAVYVDESQAVVKEPTVVVMDMNAIVENGSNKVVIIANHDAPEGYTVIQHGIVRTTNAITASDVNAFVDGGTDVRRHDSSDLSPYGVYTYTINVASSVSTVIYARGYMIVQNNATGDLITLYSDVVSGSHNSLSQ